MTIQPCLNFEGRCEEALDFYRHALGAEVTALLRYEDGPPVAEDAPLAPGFGAKVLHASFRVGGTTVVANDGRCTGRPAFDGFSLQIAAPDGVGAGRIFAALGDGGRVRLPAVRTSLTPVFGVVTDRFGVSWTVVAPAD